jgi:hypothetical protein
MLNHKFLHVYLYSPWTLLDLSPKQWHHLGLVELLSLILYQHVFFLKKYIYLLLISNVSTSTEYMYSSTYFSSQLSWCQICSRSSPTHQRCFNSFSSYRTPIDMKLDGLVHKFCKWISFKNSDLSSTYSRSYAWNIGAIRICKPCWPSYLHYFISRAMDLRVNPIGVVQEFHKIHSVQNSSILVAYTENYAQNFGGSRICRHYWHSHLV